MSYANGFEENRHRGARGMAKIASMVIGGIMLAVCIAFLFGWLVMLLWNWLMPQLFGLREITYWQGFGLVLLGKLLFGAMGGHHGDYHHSRRHAERHTMPRRLKNWFDNLGDEFWKPGGSHDNWKYYRDYWRSEGKAAFEAYLARITKGDIKEHP